MSCNVVKHGLAVNKVVVPHKKLAHLGDAAIGWKVY